MKKIKSILLCMAILICLSAVTSCSTGMNGSKQNELFKNPFDEEETLCLAHSFVDDICSICHEPFKISEGLSFTLSADSTSYMVADIGECEDTQIIIPAEHEGLPVTGIAPNAFRDEPITAAFLPEGMTLIGEWAFQSCSKLVCVDIPATVNSICMDAFRGCFRLESVTIPEGISIISSGTFQNCTSLTEIKLPETLLTIGSSAFEKCIGLKELTIPASVVEIESNAFGSCTGLKALTIPTTIPTMYAAFDGCTGLEAIHYEGSLSEWCQTEFSEGDNPLGNAHHLYVDSELIEGQFCPPDGLTRVSASMMQGNTDITGVIIGTEVTSIGAKAFADCTNLTYAVLECSPKTIATDCFEGSGIQSIFLHDTEEEAQAYIAYILGVLHNTGAKIYYRNEWLYDDNNMPHPNF